MKIFEILDNANAYISFNMFAICGWLYLPISILFFKNLSKNYHYYPIEFYLPLMFLLFIPWLITVIAFIIFLIETLKTTHSTNNFFRKNKYFKDFKYIGLLITIIFYLSVILFAVIISQNVILLHTNIPF